MRTNVTFIRVHSGSILCKDGPSYLRNMSGIPENGCIGEHTLPAWLKMSWDAVFFASLDGTQLNVGFVLRNMVHLLIFLNRIPARYDR